MNELNSADVRYDLVSSDGTVTVVDASAEATRYYVYVVRLAAGWLVAMPNWGTSYGLQSLDHHWTYLAEKLGKGNARAGMALVHILATAQAAEAEAREG